MTELKNRNDAGFDHIFYFPPHQDDELTNFGVAIMKDIDAGRRAVCVLCTDGGASGVLRMLGDGRGCHLHPGRHVYPMTRGEFSAARDREYRACCREMGLGDADARISPLRGLDGQLTVESTKEIILDAIKGLPPESVEVRALAPVAGLHQNPDHRATGTAALELFGEGAFGGLTLFYESILLPGVTGDGAPLQYVTERVEPDEGQAERFRRAADRYGIWAPEKGFYAIGHHSVKDEFEMMTADPVSLVCSGQAPAK